MPHVKAPSMSMRNCETARIHHQKFLRDIECLRESGVLDDSDGAGKVAAATRVRASRAAIRADDISARTIKYKLNTRYFFILIFIIDNFMRLLFQIYK
jgi:ribose 5-phosphate isomerase RpiB